MNRTTLHAAIVAAVLLQAGCAHAQQRPSSAPAADPPFTASGRVIPLARAAGYHGFGISGRPGPEGWVDYPRISRVDEGSPAHRAGLQVGDIVLSSNGTDARRRGVLGASDIGKVMVLRVRRGDEVREFTLTTLPNPRP